MQRERECAISATICNKTGPPAGDILILSNGPGEVTTWVRAAVAALRRELGDRCRLSVVLSPCPHASGREADVVRGYPEVDRLLEPQHFWRFLLRGKTPYGWRWSDRGVVVFLGGDQFFALVAARRLGYRTVVYAEWDARWRRWIDCFAIARPQLAADLQASTSPRQAKTFQFVGDLMADVESDGRSVVLPGALEDAELVGILPGSKAAKLARGVPFGLAVAEAIARQRPQTRFVIPVAPTCDGATLARFADPRFNTLSTLWASARLDADAEGDFLRTASGLKVYLWYPFPAHDLLRRCRLCLTTVGANTAELTALTVPMLVLIPTQQLDLLHLWDGLPGLLAALPRVGRWFSRRLEGMVLRQLQRRGRRLAWPNIWAGKAIVPEFVGRLQPEAIAREAIVYLDRPEELDAMGDRLRQVRGEPGAARKLAALVRQQLERF